MPKKSYVWQQQRWPALEFEAELVAGVLLHARQMQSEVRAKAEAIGLAKAGEIAREILTQEVVATSAIEGEKLDPAAVRSSVMRRLGLAGAGPHNRGVDAIVEVVHDAATRFDVPLDRDRLFRWHSALFPGGTSGLRRIAVGRYREHEDAMQIVSGPIGKEVVHYEAPPARKVAAEMDRFLDWFARTTPAERPQAPMDGIARAAIAHVWFETIHPFEDGNGRIGRAIVEMALAQDPGSAPRLYSLSRQMQARRTEYYDALNEAQRGTGDVTRWVQWFGEQVCLACSHTLGVVDTVLQKARFWADHAGFDMNARQRKVLQRLLDAGDGGFLGGLTAEKYMKLTAASKATATRDLAALAAGDLLRVRGQGKATRYEVNVPGWSHESPRG